MDPNLPRIDKKAPLRERAYELIKASILSNALYPGQRLREQALAANLEISPTPIREALARLGQEGMVRIIPRKGTYVTQASRRDVHEIYQLRRALEPLAVELAINAIPLEELERTENLFNSLRPALEDGKREGFLDTDLEFHYLPVRYCGNTRLIQMVGSLSDHLRRVRTVLGVEPKLDIKKSFRQHCEILAALRARDAVLASRLLQEHLQTAEENIASSLPE